MRFRIFSAFLAALFAGLLLVCPSPAEEQTVPPPSPDGTPAPLPGVDVQARGPVHEAYAEPTTSTATPGILVVKEPPAPIEEAPPEEKPAGDNIVWIPGYWNWDDETKDYLWISGFSRRACPAGTGRRATGRKWTPVFNGCPASGASRK